MTNDVARKGGRPRSGTLEASGSWPSGKPRFRGRVRLGDGTRSERFDVPEGMSEAEARKWLAGIQAAEDAQGLLLQKRQARERAQAAEAGEACDGETCDAWFARHLPTIDCGDEHRRITRHAWQKWISPVIGSKPMRSLTRDDVEDVRDALDRALDEGRIRTARNIWSTLTGALKAAYASRDRTLRVHAAPLHFGILPPKSGDSRQRPWLYPNEWIRLVGCAAVPIEWRQTYAIALYTGLRPNELRALTWNDVDLDAGQISVSKAFDIATKEVKAPKTTAGQRVVPIEPALLPLLEALHDDDGTKLVAPLVMSSEDRMASTFREHLHAAGVDRQRLFADNMTEERVDFRSLRDSYATWLALANVPEKRIQRRLGHASPSVTDKYIKAAESFDPTMIGAPFPELPEGVSPKRWTTKEKTPGLGRGFLVARVGFENTEAPASAPHSPAINELADTKPADTSISTPETGVFGPTVGPGGSVEDALARALDRASAAGEWTVVAALARELEARRLASAGVASLPAVARRRG